jgi:ACS family tartrate transporter-like MFS transporter
LTVVAGAPSEAEAYGPLGRATLRKVSWRLIPLIGLGYGAAYMDRVNISFASIQMNRDLHLSAEMYGFGAGIFFLSYALFEVPSNLLLVRFGARRWLSRIMLTWGIIAIAMLFVRTPHQFYAMRLLLGAAEAGFFPGAVHFLTEWFPPGYRARVISRFYIALPLSSTVMGSLAGSLLGLNGRLGLRGWQWLFLVEGIPPIVLSLLFLALLPDKPIDARWLCDEERTWLETQLARARPHQEGEGLWSDLRAALADIRVWTLSAFFLCILTVLYGWAFLAPAILLHLTHWTVGQVGWLIAAMGLGGAAAMLLTARHSDRSGERTWHIAIPCLVMAAGYAVGGRSHNAWVAVPAFALTVAMYNAAQGPVLALPAAFLSGRAAAVGYAVITAVGVAGGVLGPIFMGRMNASTGGNEAGLMALAAPSVVAAGLVIWMGRATNQSQEKADAESMR